MEDNDGSSNAAQSAPTKNTVKNFNLSEKFLRLFNRNKPENSLTAPDKHPSIYAHKEMAEKIYDFIRRD